MQTMSSKSLDSETENVKEVSSRLGDCEVCGSNKAIYTCPKCEVKTCSLSCVRIHKKELDCDGVRDRTKFIRMKDFTDSDLLSDYRLLEECARFVYAVKKDDKKKFTRIDKDLPIHLYKLKMAARKRGTVLQLLSRNFTRHAVNTTRYNFRSNVIYWRVEWIFPNVETNPLKFVDEKCSEQTRLSHLLDKYLSAEASPFEGSKLLAYYRSVGFSGVKVLMRAEKVKGSAKKVFELDLSESLGENLSGKCIVEFPIMFVVLKDHAYNFEIIIPEEEFGYEKNHTLDNSCLEDVNNGTQKNVMINNPNLTDSGYNYEKVSPTKRSRTLLTAKIAEEKKRILEEEIKEEKKKRPKNLLFTTGYSSEEGFESDSDDKDL